MKFRNDFVTNSSSSSYVCEICGETASGWDLCLSDTGMIQCENGHIICESEMLPQPREAMIKMMVEDFDHIAEDFDDKSDEDILTSYLDGEDLRHGVKECFCPICQFIEYSQNDLAKYLEKKYKVSRDKVFQKVKQFNKRRKKLYDSEYVTEVCCRFGLNPTEVVSGLKAKFGSYRRFKDYIRR